MRRPLSIGAALLAALIAVWVWAEVLHARSSRRRLGAWCGPVASEVVVVLGYRDGGSRAGAVNRYRVRAGLRSLDPGLPDSTLVLSGGPVGDLVAEAVLMAGYARTLGYTGPLITEEVSRTTWENVQAVIPLLEGVNRIIIVSNSLHAEKARAYLWRSRPDLAERLALGQEHRVGELAWAKPLAARIGLRALRRLDTS